MPVSEKGGAIGGRGVSLTVAAREGSEKLLRGHFARSLANEQDDGCVEIFEGGGRGRGDR